MLHNLQKPRKATLEEKVSLSSLTPFHTPFHPFAGRAWAVILIIKVIIIIIKIIYKEAIITEANAFQFAGVSPLKCFPS